MASENLNSDLIATLYPTDMSRGVTWAQKAVELNDNDLQRVKPQLTPHEDCGEGSSGDAEQEEDISVPFYMYSEGLQLRFGDQRKNPRGFLLGKSPNCDIVIPDHQNSNAVGQHQCIITFDDQGRLILEDLGDSSQRGHRTFVSYDDKGGEFKRRGFRWILSGTPFTSRRRESIVIGLHNLLRFQIVVECHDILLPQYKNRVAQFRRSAGLNASDVSLDGLNFQSLEPTAAPTGAQTLGTQAILLADGNKGNLGSGGQAFVTRLWDVSTGINYASKEPRSSQDRDELKQEAQLLSDLHHENIVKCIGWEEKPDPGRLILEYIPHGSLFDQAKKRELSAQENLEVLRQALSATKYLHSKSADIAHRDIKPGNMLVQSRDPIHIKLSDFGLSKRVEDSMRTQCGTYKYTAPEVFDRSERRYGLAVDIWSMGLVVLEYAHGLPKFDCQGILWAEKIVEFVKVKLEEKDCPLLTFLSECMLLVDPEKRLSAEECYAKACNLEESQCCCRASISDSSLEESTVRPPSMRQESDSAEAPRDTNLKGSEYGGSDVDQELDGSATSVSGASLPARRSETAGDFAVNETTLKALAPNTGSGDHEVSSEEVVGVEAAEPATQPSRGGRNPLKRRSSSSWSRPSKRPKTSDGQSEEHESEKHESEKHESEGHESEASESEKHESEKHESEKHESEKHESCTH